MRGKERNGEEITDKELQIKSTRKRKETIAAKRGLSMQTNSKGEEPSSVRPPDRQPQSTK